MKENMQKRFVKEKAFLMIFLIITLSFTVANFEEVSADEGNVCCEYTSSGDTCVYTDEDNCNGGNAVSTTCEQTSYCAVGTCYSSDTGSCYENTPRSTCEAEEGTTWTDIDADDLAQCQKGCCSIADQAFFVTEVKCKSVGSQYADASVGFDSSIETEYACLESVKNKNLGCCVTDEEYTFETREECNADEEEVGTNFTSTGFHEGMLCSNDLLSSDCAKQHHTGCFEGKVYWYDSCGNRENIYSSDERTSYNSGYILEEIDSCEADGPYDENCGNCDYLLGTRCEEFDGMIGGPVGGDHYCQKTECIDRGGDKRINGESWCVEDFGSRGSDVGSRHYREICVDGEVKVEPCSDFRNEVCLEGSIDTDEGDFGTAACRVNRWQDCVMQADEEDCLNIDQRDCKWMGSVMGMILGGGSSSSSSYSNPTSDTDTPAFTNPTAAVIAPITGDSIFGGGDDDEEEIEGTTTNRPNGICVPNFPPGLEFWKEGSAGTICGQASARCVVVYEEGLIGGSDIVEGAECLGNEWAESANAVCSSLGDCGGAVNYDGVYTDDGYNWVVDGVEKSLEE